MKSTAKGPVLSEAQFQKQVIQLAHYSGWLVAHFATAPTQSGQWATPIRADGRGFPDLVMVRERVIFAELKAQRGEVRPAQKNWAQCLTKASQEIYLWRPSDMDQIQEVLK